MQNGAYTAVLFSLDRQPRQSGNAIAIFVAEFPSSQMYR